MHCAFNFFEAPEKTSGVYREVKSFCIARWMLETCFILMKIYYSLIIASLRFVIFEWSLFLKALCAQCKVGGSDSLWVRLFWKFWRTCCFWSRRAFLNSVRLDEKHFCAKKVPYLRVWRSLQLRVFLPWASESLTNRLFNILTAYMTSSWFWWIHAPKYKYIVP